MSIRGAVARPRALLLDLDGTLVDSEPIHRTGFERWFAHRGWPFDLEVAALFTGRRADDVFRTVDGPWSGGDPDAMFAEIVAMVPRDRLPDAVPGAAATVERAAVAGIPLALVTSASVRWADKVLAALGGLGRFDVVVTRDDVAVGQARSVLLRPRVRSPRCGCRVGTCVRGRTQRGALGRRGGRRNGRRGDDELLGAGAARGRGEHDDGRPHRHPAAALNPRPRPQPELGAEVVARATRVQGVCATS